LLYTSVAAALPQADQFCLVIVKGTTDQEVPVVTATVLLILLVSSLFYVNASLFAFVLKKRPGVTYRTLGRNYGEGNLTPCLPSTAYISQVLCFPQSLRQEIEAVP
jgi:hypothetical protein